MIRRCVAAKHTEARVAAYAPPNGTRQTIRLRGRANCSDQWQLVRLSVSGFVRILHSR